MEYATEDEIEKIKYHKDEITKIKKSQDYKNLLIASRNPATNKRLERYQLNIKRHQSHVQTLESTIRNRVPKRTRDVKPRYNNFPENPAKKRELLVKEKTIDNVNNHRIIRNDKIEPVTQPMEESEFSFII